jgi:hypothetical protein
MRHTMQGGFYMPKYRLVDAGNGDEVKLGSSATVHSSDALLIIEGFEHDPDGGHVYCKRWSSGKGVTVLPSAIGVKIIEA